MDPESRILLYLMSSTQLNSKRNKSLWKRMQNNVPCCLHLPKLKIHEIIFSCIKLQGSKNFCRIAACFFLHNNYKNVGLGTKYVANENTVWFHRKKKLSLGVALKWASVHFLHPTAWNYRQETKSWLKKKEKRLFCGYNCNKIFLT